ncbi:hypothetical protein DENIT_210008 [Pseudomonas veronii]|nr:hypothetical protein DENIT_210008 [Pseudomonas veronii]
MNRMFPSVQALPLTLNVLFRMSDDVSLR